MPHPTHHEFLPIIPALFSILSNPKIAPSYYSNNYASITGTSLIVLKSLWAFSHSNNATRSLSPMSDLGIYSLINFPILLVLLLYSMQRERELIMISMHDML